MIVYSPYKPMYASEITIREKDAPVPQVVRRNTLLLAGAQGVAWLAIQSVAFLGGITADELTGDRRWAGVPVTIFILATAITAPVAGRLMDRQGRRPVLLFGLALIVLGATLIGVAVGARFFAGFLASIVVMSMGTAVTSLSRSAAADMYPPARRAQGLGVVIMGGAVGAVLGPFVLRGLADWATGAGLNADVAPWLGIPPLAALALVGVLFMRSDPRQIAANLSRYYPGEVPAQIAGSEDVRPLGEILRRYPVMVAIAATGFVQAGMVMLMVTVALSMKDHGHEGAVAGVMSGHFVGMLGLSVLIGRLADRLGRRSVVMLGALIFIAGATTAPLINDPLVNGVSLFLVGVGWSFCYVAGNTILADLARPSERGRLLGANDLIVGMIGAVASLTSGIILGGAGFLAVGALGLALGLVPMLLALRLHEPQPGKYDE